MLVAGAGTALFFYGAAAQTDVEKRVRAAVAKAKGEAAEAASGSEKRLKEQLRESEEAREALSRRDKELAGTITQLEAGREELLKEKESQRKLRATLNETIVDKQETIEKLKADVQEALKSVATEQALRNTEVGAGKAQLAAVEQNAVTLRLELEMERIGRVAAEKTAMGACEKADIARAEMDGQLRVHSEKRRTLEAELAKLQSERTASDADLSNANVAVATLEKQLADARSDAEVTRAALEQAKSEPEKARAVLLKQLHDAQADLDAFKRELEAVRAAAKAGEAEIAVLRGQVSHSKAELAELQSRVEVIQREMNESQKELSVAKSGVADLEVRLSEANDRALVALSGMVDSMADVQRELESGKRTVANLSEELVKTGLQLDDARAEASFWRSECDNRKRSAQETEERVEGLRAALERSKAVPSAAESSEARHREHIIAELVKTEMDYVADLSALDEVVLMPLRAGAVFKPEKAASLFKEEELDSMTRASMQLLSNLQKKPDCSTVAKVFSTFIDVALASYSSYCSGTFSALTELFLKNNNAKWIAFRRKVEGNVRLRGLPLDAVFIKPVQRLCKYPLLLVELRKNTAPNTTDNADLAKVIEKLNKAIAHINAIRRESELMHRAVEIEQSGVSGVPVGFWSSNPDRRLLREEHMMLSSQNGKPTRVLCWMFSDCVVFSKRTKLRITSSQMYSAVIPPVFFSVTLLLNDVPDDAEKGVSNAVEFSFVDPESNERQQLVLLAPSREIKLEWFHAIRGICEKIVIQNPRPKREEVKSNSATTIVMNPLKRFGVSAPAPLAPPSEAVEKMELHLFKEPQPQSAQSTQTKPERLSMRGRVSSVAVAAEEGGEGNAASGKGKHKRSKSATGLHEIVKPPVK